MITLTIDQQEVQVPENFSVMRAAESLGIEIPAMCFMEGYTNHPSCMVCLVKDRKSRQLFASCAMPVAGGMDVITNDEEVREARKEALELLLSDHVGDCEAPCRNGCPAFMDIPRMNRLIAEGRFREALETVKEEIALPLILGYICEAPCEKVCRREPIDGAVSICQLKRFVAAADLESDTPYFPDKVKPSGNCVTIVGAGPAGLASAFYLTLWGHHCKVYDLKTQAGGTLLDIPASVLPGEALRAEISYIEKFGVEFCLGQPVDGEFLDKKIKPESDAVILATGLLSDEMNRRLGVLFDTKGYLVNKDTWETNVEGIFSCGSAIRKQQMAIRAVAQGKAAAWSVNEYLAGRSPGPKPGRFNSRFGKLRPEEYGEYLKESISLRRQDPSDGKLAGFLPEEASREARRCMNCDCRKPDSCKLRIYADEYGADQKKYRSEQRKPVIKQYTHESIVYEQEKCIKCGLCVGITAGAKELTGLTFIGRGFDVRIGVPFTRELGEALTLTAAKCAKACPTAAISMKIRDK